jgi:hypothetical protein
MWDRDFIESQFNLTFETEADFSTWISDKSVEIIKEAIENKKIWWMVKIEPVQFK